MLAAAEVPTLREPHMGINSCWAEVRVRNSDDLMFFKLGDAIPVALIHIDPKLINTHLPEMKLSTILH